MASAAPGAAAADDAAIVRVLAQRLLVGKGLRAKVRQDRLAHHAWHALCTSAWRAASRELAHNCTQMWVAPRRAN